MWDASSWFKWMDQFDSRGLLHPYLIVICQGQRWLADSLGAGILGDKSIRISIHFLIQQWFTWYRWIDSIMLAQVVRRWLHMIWFGGGTIQWTGAHLISRRFCVVLVCAFARAMFVNCAMDDLVVSLSKLGRMDWCLWFGRGVNTKKSRANEVFGHAGEGWDSKWRSRRAPKIPNPPDWLLKSESMRSGTALIHQLSRVCVSSNQQKIATQQQRIAKSFIEVDQMEMLDGKSSAAIFNGLLVSSIGYSSIGLNNNFGCIGVVYCYGNLEFIGSVTRAAVGWLNHRHRCDCRHCNGHSIYSKWQWIELIAWSKIMWEGRWFDLWLVIGCGLIWFCWLICRIYRIM